MSAPEKFPFFFKKSFTPEEQETKELKSNFGSVLDPKISSLQETLQHGLDSFSSLDLTQAAKDFRKLATDLKLLEQLITHRGKSSEKNVLNDLTGKEWLQHTKSWLVVDGKPGDISKEIKDHPASYPPDLAAYFISYFSKANDWVFDPFLGIGSTAAACKTTLRNCFGTELNQKYFEYAKQRVVSDQRIVSDPTKTIQFQLFNADARQATELWQKAQINPINFLITSPPYWSMLKKSRGGVKSDHKQRVEDGHDDHYSDNPADLGNIEEYSEYIETLTDLFGNFRPLLKDGAYLMVILQNCRPSDGIMRPLAWDFAKSMQKNYILRQEFIWCQDQKFMGIWGWPTTYVSNVHHHYCLVFQNLQNLKKI